jgi:hypothetical protein
MHRKSPSAPLIFDWMSDETLLAKAFCSIDIITRPGTRNAAYVMRS